ncbi:hypothetical protein SUGI_0416990 [Cryptomeria japonica]|nr:hypothetical protein SUGI_0416990 [Cryptomeria japonica]
MPAQYFSDKHWRISSTEFLLRDILDYYGYSSSAVGQSWLYPSSIFSEKKKDKKKNKEKDKDDQKDKEKEMSINIERVKYWLSVGAQPTETVQHLLSKAGLSAMDRKGGQRNRYVIDPSTGRPVAPEKNQKNFSDIKDDFSVEQI